MTFDILTRNDIVEIQNELEKLKQQLIHLENKLTITKQQLSLATEMISTNSKVRDLSKKGMSIALSMFSAKPEDQERLESKNINILEQVMHEGKKLQQLKFQLKQMGSKSNMQGVETLENKYKQIRLKISKLDSQIKSKELLLNLLPQLESFSNKI